MEAEVRGKGVEFLRPVREFGEDAHSDGTEQGSRGPEGETGLEDMVGGPGGLCSHGCSGEFKPALRQAHRCEEVK